MDRSARVLAGLRPVLAIKGAGPIQFGLADRMRHYRVPGVSIAVADGGRLAWTRGFGVKRVGTTDPVTPATMFQAASISKVVTATATLRRVEEGKLSLDQDVNTYLKSWHLSDNEFTRTEKVTLRRILSHSAGLTGHTVGGYGPTDPLPSLPEILDGKKPAKTAAVRVDAIPGSISRYSGAGVTIEQLVLTDSTGRDFPELVKELVFDPIGMRHSTFEPSLPAALEALASSAHDSAGRPRASWRFSEVAAAGLWSTPTDLLAWAIEIAGAREGKSPAVLSEALARQMLTVQKGPFGLGPVLEGSGRAFRFGHQGWNEGFHSEIVYFPETNQGAVVMVNADGGRPLVREILYAIAAEYAWQEFAPQPIEPIATTQRDLETLPGKFEALEPEHVVASVRRSGDKLLLDAPRVGTVTELVFSTADTVIALDTGDRFSVVRGADGRVMALDFGIVMLKRVEAESK
jgi:CubicO group peptidase (beta-lactamase class C family)